MLVLRALKQLLSVMLSSGSFPGLGSAITCICCWALCRQRWGALGIFPELSMELFLSGSLSSKLHSFVLPMSPFSQHLLKPGRLPSYSWLPSSLDNGWLTWFVSPISESLSLAHVQCLRIIISFILSCFLFYFILLATSLACRSSRARGPTHPTAMSIPDP